MSGTSGLFERIGNSGILPVVTLPNADVAAPLAKALQNGGLDVMEIAFRSDAAEDGLRQVAKSVPDVTLGAGTVVTPEQARKAVECGAKFIVTPGFNPATVEYCVKNCIPIIPGVATGGEIEQAMMYEFQVVKFFPAQINGGIAALKAFYGPYAHMSFVPTGGIGKDNVADYLALPNVLACGGSWMMEADAIKRGDFVTVTHAARETVKKMLRFRFAHIGINNVSGESAEETARFFANLLGSVKEGNSSIFVTSQIEVIKADGVGEHGHIALYTPNVKRAVHYLQKWGIACDDASAKYAGKILNAIYLKERIAGFGIHLLRG